MGVILIEFFDLVGLNLAEPTCLSELIPWLAVLLAGSLLIAGVLRLLGVFIRTLFDWRRY